jgi:hypothetical protein
MITGHRQNVAATGRCQCFKKAMNFLTQRGPGLLLRPAAPEQFRQSPAQCGARRRQRYNGQQRSGLSALWQYILAGERPCLHLADQSQTHNH